MDWIGPPSDDWGQDDPVGWVLLTPVLVLVLVVIFIVWCLVTGGPL